MRIAASKSAAVRIFFLSLVQKNESRRGTLCNSYEKIATPKKRENRRSLERITPTNRARPIGQREASTPSAFEQEAQKRDHSENTNPEEAELANAPGRMFAMLRNLMVVIQDRHRQPPNRLEFEA